jgi:hypothetical protein
MLKAIAWEHEESPLLCLHSTKRSKVDASELSKKIREKERMIPKTSQRAKATHPKKSKQQNFLAKTSISSKTYMFLL